MFLVLHITWSAHKSANYYKLNEQSPVCCDTQTHSYTQISKGKADAKNIHRMDRLHHCADRDWERYGGASMFCAASLFFDVLKPWITSLNMLSRTHSHSIYSSLPALNLSLQLAVQPKEHYKAKCNVHFIYVSCNWDCCALQSTEWSNSLLRNQLKL